MYKYKLLASQKVGGRNILYSVENLLDCSISMFGLGGLKPLLNKNEIVNATWRNRVVEIPDVRQGLGLLIESLHGKSKIYANVTRVVDQGQRRYMKFSNSDDEDITYYVWMSLARYYTLTQNNELSVCGKGIDHVAMVKQHINEEAHECGMRPIIKDCLLKK